MIFLVPLCHIDDLPSTFMSRPVGVPILQKNVFKIRLLRREPGSPSNQVILWVFLDIVCKLGFILLYQYLMYIKQKERRAAAVKKPSENTFSGDPDGRR